MKNLINHAESVLISYTVQKIMFFIKDFFGKCN